MLKLFEIVKGGTLWVFWKSNLLRGVTSQTSDIALYSGYYVQVSDGFGKIIGKYILTKPNFRRKMTSLNSLKVPKNIKKGDPLGLFNIYYVIKKTEKLKGDPFETFKKIFEKKNEKLNKKEFWASLIVPKNLKGETLCAFWNFNLL